MRLRTAIRSAVLANLSLGAFLAMFTWSIPSSAAAASCNDPSNLCMQPVKGSRWDPGVRTNAKEKSRRTVENGGTLTLTIENGRGSVFLNGRFVGTAPLDGIPISRGKNDIQVRDGDTVLASGVLVVSKGASIVVTVNHP